MRIEVVSMDGGLRAYCPFSKRFVDFAHMRNGQFSDSSKSWLFDVRDEFAVRSTLIDIYGTDDYEHAEKVDIRINLDHYNTNVTRVFIAGREIAWRKFWDRAVFLGEGIVVLAGGFADEPISKRERTCDARKGTIIEARDVPIRAAEKSYRKRPEAVEILGGLRKDSLLAEREHLLARLQEIDTLLLAEEAHEKEDDDGIIPDLRDTAESASTDCC